MLNVAKALRKRYFNHMGIMRLQPAAMSRSLRSRSAINTSNRIRASIAWFTESTRGSPMAWGAKIQGVENQAPEIQAAVREG
jgi:hypothetical protein